MPDPRFRVSGNITGRPDRLNVSGPRTRSAFASSEVVAIVDKLRPVLRDRGIRSTFDLRRLAAQPRELDKLKLDAPATRNLSAFAALARVFPSGVAVALQEAKARSLADLKSWGTDRFARTLREAGIDERDVQVEQVRFERLKKLLAAGTDLDEVNGISLDLGEDDPLTATDKKALARAGIETLADWAALRDQVKISSDKRREMLDAYARLRLVGATGRIATALYKAGIRSMFDLAQLDAGTIEKIARQSGLTPDTLMDLVSQAQYRTRQASQLLYTTQVYQDAQFPEWLDWSQILSGAAGGTAGTESQCDRCSEELSVFSEFAYFVYLVQLTGQTLSELEDRLHQDLSALSPASGQEEVAQIKLCVEVLSKAYPGALNHAEQLPVTRRLLVGGLVLLAQPIETFAEQAVQYLPGLSVTDLATRLRQAINAPLMAPAPNFTENELQVLGQLLEGLVTERLAEEIRSEPEFAGASNAELVAEARERLQPLMEPSRLEATQARREAYKQRSGKSDRELYEELFIETNLGTCETITRLKQAIRSLQAYLNHLIETTNDTEQRDAYRYLSYEAWRAERMGGFYPELNALWRDDILTGESGPWDRGSILFGRANARSRLEDALQTVEAAIENALVSNGRLPADFRQDPDLLNGNDVTDFASTTFIHDLRRGLDVIRDVLKADDAVQEAATHLDQFQPGQALGSLNEALSHLDRMAGRVFLPTSAWVNPAQLSRRRYEDLAHLSVERRKVQMILLGSELLLEPKAVFMPDVNTLRTGLELSLSGGLVHSLESWSAGTGFRLANALDGPGLLGHIVKDANTSGDVDTIRQFRYTEGAALRDYTITVNLEATEGRTIRPQLQIATGEILGLAVRLDANGNNGYRFGIRSERVAAQGTGGVLRHFLVLQEVRNGTVTELARSEESLHFEVTPTSYTLSLSVSTSNSGAASFQGRVESSVLGSPRELSYTDNSPRTQGTFALLASETIGAHFGPLFVEIESVGEVGIPPFYAPRRGRDFGTHFLSAGAVYHRRNEELAGMAVDLADVPLTFTSQDVTAQPLTGLFAPNGNSRYLLFREGETTVSLDGLDTLLDHLMALSFYLRYAAIPTRMAQAYLQSGDFAHAADMLHLIYDENGSDEPMYNIPGGEDAKSIYPGLAAPPETLAQALGADVRLMRLRLAEVYLAWAEWLFRQNTDDSRHEARLLYERVLALHEDRDYCQCDESLGAVTEKIRNGLLEITGTWGLDDLQLREEVLEAFGRLAETRNNLPISIDLSDSISGSDLSKPDGLRKALSDIETHLDQAASDYRSTLDKGATYSTLAEKGANLMRRAELETVSRLDFDVVKSSLTSHPIFAFYSGSTGNGFNLPIANAVFSLPFWSSIPVTIDRTFCVPPNPLKTQQKRQACLMLGLLHECRNILGWTDELVPALRFEALLRLAGSFTQLARSAENDLLNFRQAFEQESFSLLQANNNLALSDADVRLESMNVGQTEGDIRQAVLQQMQATSSVAHFETLIAEGLSSMEKLALGSAVTSAVFSGVAALPALIGAAVAAGGLAGMATGNVPAGSVATVAGLFGSLAAGPQSLASFSSSISQAAGMQASYERREQEWRYNLEQSRWGAAIAQQNTLQAFGRLEIALQREAIAGLKRQFAADGVQFLRQKFLNGAMWVLMQSIIRDEYRTRLNYAISAAFMAERALAFELQNRSLQVVRFDYFDPQRDGLLGATELQTDLATLESTKLAFTERKLQLSKTLSLAQLMPVEFQRFKDGSGQLPFNTVMDWFDRDHPGHYMRLIKSVKVSVVALVPPLSGIHASLKNNGISTVIAGPPFSAGFKEQTIRRNPESIALSSPFQASGLFVLDYKDALLLPFEGSGVETGWVFEMPKAANPFDYRTIADVLVTVEYTALDSDTHRAEVVSRLDRTFTADRAFSFRYQLADQWFDLHNPDQTATPMTVRFDTRRADFPPNLDGLKIEQIVLYFARKDGSTFEIPVTHLKFDDGSGTPAGGSATTANGLASTRDNSGSNWMPVLDKSPVGEWELSLPDTDAVRNRFADEEIEDILLVITFSGTTPEWPA